MLKPKQNTLFYVQKVDIDCGLTVPPIDPMLPASCHVAIQSPVGGQQCPHAALESKFSEVESCRFPPGTRGEKLADLGVGNALRNMTTHVVEKIRVGPKLVIRMISRIQPLYVHPGLLVVYGCLVFLIPQTRTFKSWVRHFCIGFTAAGNGA